MQKDAADAIELMFAAALEDGFTLYAISGYRSYNRQKEIFLNNIVHRGKRHTLKYSAAPGTSEHQTGLAMDVSSKSVRYKLVTSFSNCDEGKWLANHSYKFGFIIRYPKDQYDFTGYAYEPWHIRYVGKDLANYLYTNNMTLDEYYKYTPNEGFDYEEKYSNLINYKPPVTPTPIPEEELEENDPLDDLIDKDLEDDELDEDPDDDLDKDPDDDLEDDDLEDDDLDKDSDEDLEDDDSVDENEDGNLEDDELEENDASDKSPSPTPSPIPSPTPMPTKPPTDNSKEIDSSNLNNPPPSNPDTDVID
jgi:D-alanyl-D-alanine carboxypeptidase